VRLQEFMAEGFQTNSSSPLILNGHPIGKNAVWHPTLGPRLSNTLALIPGVMPTGAPSPFNRAACQAEYSQDQVVTEDGESTLTVNMYGVRCEPTPTAALASAAVAAAHINVGTYSLVGGTGQFHTLLGGTGNIQFYARANGNGFVHIAGHLA